MKHEQLITFPALSVCSAKYYKPTIDITSL